MFQYDGLGNLRQRQVGTRTIALSYDANNRLSSHTDTAGSPRSLSYDARGNVTALGALGFSYDVSDQPRTVTGSATGSYTYDGHLRRVKQVVGGVTRYSVYDAGGGLVEIDEVGGAKTDYIRASGMTLARIVGSTVTWLHHDHLGSAVAGTNSAGTVVWRESEQPFGEDWTTAAANDNQAGYTGHVEDAATGLVYMQARYYDPVIGRFLSIDPVGFSPARPDMFNRYAYAANDPVNLLDPDGRMVWIIPLVCAAGACEGAVATATVVVGIAVITQPKPEAVANEIVITPGGRQIEHGKETEKYIKKKGWTEQQIDDLLDDPADSYENKKKNHRSNEKQTTFVGEDGEWIVVDSSGRITQLSERGNEKQPKPEPDDPPEPDEPNDPEDKRPK